jgi:plastocyanin
MGSRRWEMRRLTITLVVLALGAAGFACAEEQPAVQSQGGGSDEGHGGHEHEDAGEGHDAQGTMEIGGVQATYHGTTSVAGMPEFEIELDDNYFGPTVLEGEPGQQLALGMYNEGDLPHTFTIDEAGVDEELPTGTDATSIDVTFPDTGALVFYCRFHRDQGMVGALSVDGSLEAGGASADDGAGGYG